MLQFSAYAKQATRTRPVVSLEAEKYKGYLRFEFGYYILADNMLVLNDHQRPGDHRHVTV